VQEMNKASAPPASSKPEWVSNCVSSTVTTQQNTQVGGKTANHLKLRISNRRILNIYTFIWLPNSVKSFKVTDLLKKLCFCYSYFWKNHWFLLVFYTVKTALFFVFSISRNFCNFLSVQ
jgi:hypothetical protein